MKQCLKNITLNPFASAVALWSVVALVRAIADPGSVAAHGIISRPLYYIWAGMYGLGGLLLLIGQCRLSPKVGSIGCVLFAQGAFVSAMSIMLNPIDGYWPALNAVIFGIAATLRFRHLIQGETLQWVNRTLELTDSRCNTGNDLRSNK